MPGERPSVDAAERPLVLTGLDGVMADDGATLGGVDETYRNVPIGKLRRLAESGDSGAQNALSDFGRELSERVPALPDFTASIREQAQRLGREQEAMAVKLQREAEEVAERRALREREAVTREEAMLREIAAMRGIVERSETREAAAEARAQAAEAREADRRNRAERREWAMAVMTAVSVVAAIVAIFT